MKKLETIATLFKESGVELYYVGGYVRDSIMNRPTSDIDVCIVGANTAAFVQEALERYKNLGIITDLTSVHGEFPIWIVEIEKEKYEFAMARKERKTGQSHQDFLCEVNNVTIEEDLERRDLTINAIAKHILSGAIVDPFDGMWAIKHKIAKNVSDAFSEDPLRVYRTARFIATFDLTPSGTLFAMCSQLRDKAHSISNERVGLELMKVFKKAKNPSKFFYFLKDIRWLDKHFKEVYDLIGVPQSPTHHPEGDVFTHTMHCIDVPKDWFYRTVMLCHDLGKATHTTVNGANYIHLGEPFKELLTKDLTSYKISSIGHEEAGVQLTKNLLQRICLTSHKEIRKIALLVELHMIRIMFSHGNEEKIVRKTLRKLMDKDLRYMSLIYIVYCDLKGRPPKNQDLNFGELLINMHHSLSQKLQREGEMIPIVTGKKLLELGVPQTKEMRAIIDHALELQDRGTLKKDNWKKVMKGCGYESLKNINHEEETEEMESTSYKENLQIEKKEGEET
jgi:tRNA nucleotidyltransferase (CCA-adding enzyme)